MLKKTKDLRTLEGILTDHGVHDDALIDDILEAFRGKRCIFSRSDALIDRHNAVIRLRDKPAAIIHERTGIPLSTIYWILRQWRQNADNHEN